MKKLEGQVAVVTGASKGIGASIAQHLAAEGASVVVNYASSKEGADRVVESITKAGGKAVAVQGDMSKSPDIKRLFAETTKKYGKLDILVNNAGIYEFAPIEQITSEHLHKMFDLNVFGLILATQEALNHFNTAGGSIINISSVVSTLAPPAATAYSATKGAVDTLTKSLAKELGSRKIRVNSINPGMIETEGLQSMGEVATAMQAEVLTRTPLGRIGQPQDIATAAVFFASADSQWITGESLFITGGLR